MAAAVAPLDVPTEGRGATKFDRGHGTALCGRERSAVLLTISLTVAAEHVRHLQGASRHADRRLEMLWRSWLWRGDKRLWQKIERARRRTDLARGDPQIASSGGEAAMPEQKLNRTDIGAEFEKMHSECVPTMSPKT